MFKIGNVEINGQLVVGPMAGISNTPFRLIAKEFGANLVVAEMVSIEGMNHDNQKTFAMLDVNQQEHPMSMQIFGNDVESFIKATKWIDANVDCDIIDLNIGCPAPKVAIKSASGSSLLKTPDLIYEIVKAVVSNTKKPVTAKIRLGWDKDSVNAIEVAQLIEKAGASAITVHGRTRSDFFTGKADWEKIKQVKDAVLIPVIGNGDVTNGPSAKAMLELTGCEAVMISRGCQGNPWVFREIQHYLKTGETLNKPTLLEWKELVLRHAQMLVEFRGDENRAMHEFRQTLAWYMDRLDKTNKLKQLKTQAVQIDCIDDIKVIINKYEQGEL